MSRTYKYPTKDKGYKRFVKDEAKDRKKTKKAKALAEALKEME